MRIDEAEDALRAHLAAHAVRLDGGDVDAVMARIMEWYALERAVDAAPIDEDGDMLLFQWGAHDGGSGPAFEYALTRQLLQAGEAGDDGIIQLSVTCRYPATDETATVGSGHRWCMRPDDLAAFRRALANHPATVAITSLTPDEVVIRREVAG